MRALHRRLGRLEERLGLGPETAEDIHLRARIENGMRRVEEARSRGELAPAAAYDEPWLSARREALRPLYSGFAWR